jgi:aminoglycoside/choline kinase family phosphotransferase
VLLEDLGDDLFSRVLARGGDEQALYEAAVDLLVELQRHPPPDGLPAYDDAWLLREASLLPEWYAPDAPADDYRAIWEGLLPHARAGADGFVYVDYPMPGSACSISRTRASARRPTTWSRCSRMRGATCRRRWLRR